VVVMVKEIKEIQFLKNIGLLMTYKCQVKCPHCIIEAGPQRTEEMSLEDAFDWIDQIVTYRKGHIQVLSLTGGEPFFNIRNLQAITEYAGQQGLLVSAVTNAFWAASLEAAIYLLENLPDLKMLQISTDVYHQRSISFERVKNAIAAAEVCGIPFTLSVCTENENDPEYLTIIRELEQLTDPRSIFTAITFQAGRALKQSGQHDYAVSQDPPIGSCGAGGAPIIFPDGRVIACIGPIVDLINEHPLVLGSLRENTLGEILDRAESNVILHAIRLWGPKRLIRYLQKAGLESELPGTYIKDSVCHTCYELMANSSIVTYLIDLSGEYEFNRKVAYGRVYYMNEPQMAIGMGLHEQSVEIN
jgi:organic radical activating enzyme